MSILAAIPVLVNLGGQVFSATNPNDVKRLRAIERLKDQVINDGDACAYAYLVCWSGSNSLRDKVKACGGLLTAEDIAKNTPCGMATEVGKTACKAAIIEIKARRTISEVAGQVMIGALKVQYAADPANTPPVIIAGQPVKSGTLLLVGAAAVVLFLLSRRK